MFWRFFFENWFVGNVAEVKLSCKKYDRCVKLIKKNNMICLAKMSTFQNNQCSLLIINICLNSSGPLMLDSRRERLMCLWVQKYYFFNLALWRCYGKVLNFLCKPNIYSKCFLKSYVEVGIEITLWTYHITLTKPAKPIWHHSLSYQIQP